MCPCRCVFPEKNATIETNLVNAPHHRCGQGGLVRGSEPGVKEEKMILPSGYPLAIGIIGFPHSKQVGKKGTLTYSPGISVDFVTHSVKHWHRSRSDPKVFRSRWSAGGFQGRRSQSVYFANATGAMPRLDAWRKMFEHVFCFNARLSHGRKHTGNYLI